MAKFKLVAAAAAVATASFMIGVPVFANTNSAALIAANAATNTRTNVRVSPNTRYCIMTYSTGTRIDRKVCQTKDEWAEEGVDVSRYTRR